MPRVFIRTVETADVETEWTIVVTDGQLKDLQDNPETFMDLVVEGEVEVISEVTGDTYNGEDRHVLTLEEVS